MSTDYVIRFAEPRDIPRLGELLRQVCDLHCQGRPDLFQEGRKYTDAQLRQLLSDSTRPILVATDATDTVLGYCFCILRREGGAVLRDVQTLYIDDLCVDEEKRGCGIGRRLYGAACALGRSHDCYNITLNVWACNDAALAFYRSLGLAEQKLCMEQLL